MTNQPPNEHCKTHRNHKITGILQNIFDDNASFRSTISQDDFKAIAHSQASRATVVMCSDSRVQTTAFGQRPENDLFLVRNIGNQVITAQGSIEFGVNHIHTPVLMILGHSQCGAVEAAMQDYSGVSPHIQKELDTLNLCAASCVNQGVAVNVHQQVAYAVTLFKDKIDKDELLVIGAIYDFRNDFNHGLGRMILIDINGEQDPDVIRQNPFIETIDDIAVGIPENL